MGNAISRSKFTVTRRKKKKNVELNTTYSRLTKEDVESFLVNLYEKERLTEMVLHTGPRGLQLFRKAYENYIQAEVPKIRGWENID